METMFTSAREQYQLLNARASADSKEQLTFGIAGLDNLLNGFLPGELIVLYGSTSAYQLTDHLIVSAIARNKTGTREDIIYIDGGNRFNLYRISSLIRILRLDVKEGLRRIHISRAFTSHQLTTLIVRELDKELKKHPSRLVVVSDLLSISRDDEIEPQEGKNMLNQAILKLRELTTNNKLNILLTDSALKTPIERSHLQIFLWPKSDIILRFKDERKRTRITLEKHPTVSFRSDIEIARSSQRS